MVTDFQNRANPDSGSRPFPYVRFLITGCLVGGFAYFLLFIEQSPLPQQVILPEIDKQQTKEIVKPLEKESETNSFDFYNMLQNKIIYNAWKQKILPDDKPAPTAAPVPAKTIKQVRPDQPQYIQIASFNQSNEADGLRAKLLLLGFSAQVKVALVNNTKWHRVRVGPITDPAIAQSSLAQLRANGFQPILLKP